MEQRLQKLLAAAGIGSRRYCEGLVSAGRVTVNGVPVTQLGAKADPNADEIRIDGKSLSASEEKIYIVLNKPLDYVATVRDPHAKQTVMDLVKSIPQRIYPVGRLDADTAGLLILSNDGDFAQSLTHPSHEVPKTYRAVVRGEVSEWAAADLRRGILLDDGMTAPAKVEWVDFDEDNNATIVDISIHEGRNRQVRRMFDAVGYPVLALTRIQIGPVKLKGLAPGAWRTLLPAEVSSLINAADPAHPELPQAPSTLESIAESLGKRKDGVPRPKSVRPKPTEAKDHAIVEAAKALTEALNSPEGHRDPSNRPERTNRKPTLANPKPTSRKIHSNQ